MTLLRTYIGISWRQWLLLIIFWLFIAVIITSQLYFNSIKNGLEPSWAGILAGQLPIWLMWAAISPAILYVVNNYPLERNKLLRSGIAYGISSLIILFLTTNLTLVYMFSFYGYVDLTNTSLGQYVPYFFSRFTNDFLIFNFVLILSIAARSYTLRKNNQLNLALLKLKNDQLKNELTQSQLHALKLQLNPHFLFNTLNTISSLTLVGEHNTSVQVTLRLSDFLRRTLDFEEDQYVSLEKELEFFDLYVEIEQIRFGNRLVLKKDIDSNCLSVRVPNLILQPLIENAIKYGIARKSNSRLVELRIWEDNKNLNITLFNEGPFFDRKYFQREGIGLKNVKSRLAKLYDNHQSFGLYNDEDRNGVICRISIPSQTEGVAL